jgi:D-arabinose 5-phosphate isomerase GutQ
MECFQVALVDVPGEEIAFVAALRTVGRLSLAQATAIHLFAREHGRTVIATGLARAVADHIAATLTAAGTRVVVTASPSTTPMVCAPDVATPYRWSGTRRLVVANINLENLQS